MFRTVRARPRAHDHILLAPVYITIFANPVEISVSPLFAPKPAPSGCRAPQMLAEIAKKVAIS